jgi:hypothetical protein
VSWAQLNDPKHWRARAVEVRAVAEHISDPLSKDMMLKVADEYERLANQDLKLKPPLAFPLQCLFERNLK